MMTKVQAIQSKAVSDILDTKQMVRYHQLELQQQGIGAVGRNKDLAAKLGLTDDQVKQIGEIQRQSGAEMQAAMQAAGGPQAFRTMSPEDRQKLFAKMADSRKATEAKMVALLTDKQQAKWKEMTGAHFDFPAMGPGFGRRPGGPPPGQ
ncbi:MAG TPA: Spy/CpxP family protein refolding chaperone [Chloroflexota bacterium]|nr:Spy/CpxP family protein refolding chaperone [Chloroflexota bacterium]